MKKMLYALVMTAFVFFSSCSNTAVPPFARSAGVITKCCNGLVLKRSSVSRFVMVQDQPSDENAVRESAYPLFPEYTWDTKMLIW